MIIRVDSVRFPVRFPVLSFWQMNGIVKLCDGPPGDVRMGFTCQLVHVDSGLRAVLVAG